MNGAANEGERRRDERLATLEARRAVIVRRGRRALLTALLADGTATADDVRAAVAMPDDVDARCLGAVPSALAAAGLIALDGYQRTARPERHASVIARWRLADADAARRWLAENADLPDPPAPDGDGEGWLFEPPELNRPAAATVGRHDLNSFNREQA